MVVQGVGIRHMSSPSFEVSAPRFPAPLCYTMDMEKRIGKRWLSYGRVSGFAIGFNISSYSIGLELGFWYIGVEL